MNSPIGLESLFKEKIFRIPDYQRGYAWQKSNCKDFWEDLINLHEGRAHYTGVITLKEIPQDEIREDSNEFWLVDDHSYKVYNIIDGQQRLTTCIIFLQSLIEFVREIRTKNEDKLQDAANDGNIYLNDSLTLKAITEKFIYEQKPSGDKFRTYKFGYTIDNPSYKYMRFNVLGEKDGGSIQETFYTINLKNAKTYFLGQLREFYQEGGEDMSPLQDLYKKITKRFLFNEYNIKDEFDVFVAFETMNNRGKILSKLELLKNRLIYLTTLYPNNTLDNSSRKSLRDDINAAWKEIYYQLGRNYNKPLNDDDFLKAHWIMSFPYSRKKGDDYINFLLNEQFSPKKVYEHSAKEVPLELVEETVTEFEFNDEDGDGEDEVGIQTLRYLAPMEIRKYVNSLQASAVHWFNSHYPFLANAEELTDEEKQWLDKLNRIGMGYFRPLTMSILKNTPVRKGRVEVFKKIERYIFVCFQLSQARRNYGDSEFYKAAREYDQKKLTLNDLIFKLRERESPYFNVDGSLNTKYFSDYMYKKFFIGAKRGYYEWHGLKYFLYEYELQKMKMSGQKKVDWNILVKNERDVISIEHIFPQTATDYWKNAFHDVPEDRRHFYSGALGNLLLLSRSINSALQNDDYNEKRNPRLNDQGEILRKGYADGSHSEIEVALLYPDKWNCESIEKRSLDLLKFMEERWAVQLKNDEDRKKLLFFGLDE